MGFLGFYGLVVVAYLAGAVVQSVKRMVPVVLIGLALTACASKPAGPEWSQPGATDQQLAQDRYACEKENTQPSFFRMGAGANFRMAVNKDLYRSCMRARGWTGSE